MVEYHFGYWVFGRDMLNVNLQNLKENKVTDIFLNYYAFNTHGEQKVLKWIEEAKNKGINIHIWMQCFYDGSWHNPKTTNLENKLNEAKRYANMKNVYGVHLDYLRYSGNAYKTNGGADAITNFVKRIRDVNPKTFLSCAVMPEKECKYYYGQDIDALGKLVNAVIPMQYKGNYKGGTDWLVSTTKFFSGKANIWSGLQAYKSDNNPTPLGNDELVNDCKTCLNNGAKGVILFRYGLSPNINFNLFNKGNNKKMSKRIVRDDVLKMAQDFKEYVEAGKGVPYKFKYHNVEYITPEMTYAFIYCLFHLKSNFDIPTPIQWCEEAKGDNIVENIYTDDYKQQAKNVYNYILKHNQIPNYVTTIKSKKKVNIDLFTYCLAKILTYYKNHKELPNYCSYDSSAMTGKGTSSSSSSSSSSGLRAYMENQGCSGIGQCNGYFCACNALQQCFHRLTGIWVDEYTIARWAGTTESGTGHLGIETAIAQFNKVYGQNVKISWKSFSEVGWDGLQKAINNGAMFNHILYRDEWGHYEVPKQITSDNVIVLNSLGDKCNSPAYCGYVETRSKNTHRRYINGISQKSVAILTKG